METNYLEELNESQRAAVVYNDGPALVIAGAGSGKTRVLTYKIAYLLENGYEPWNILALTFTNKAAREMKDRIRNQVGDRAQALWMGTFHSIFSRILRAEADKIGFTSNYTIYDSSDSKSLISTIIKEMGLDEKKYKPGHVQSRISNAKNHLVTPMGYASSARLVGDDNAQKIPYVRDIYQRYWNRCRQANAMDFDDLLLNTYLLFRDFPDVLNRYRMQFRYVLVDEYQDTNQAQHSIVQQLAGVHQHVCVVGDDAQSIYSFRGADIDNILYFTKMYNNTRVFKLEQNYRSTQMIVNAANSLISKNLRQIHKEVFSEKKEGDALELLQAYSDVEEAEIVARKLLRMKADEKADFADFAVLYRTNAQSRVFEESFRKKSIPYKIYGGLSFYQRKEIKDVIAYFRMTVNACDEEAFKRVVNYPARGIGNTTLGKMSTAAAQFKASLWNVLCNPVSYQVNVNKSTLNKLLAFQQLIEEFQELAESLNAYDLGAQIVRSSGILADVCQDNTPENQSRRENIEELLNAIQDFCNTRQEEGNKAVHLSDFLSEVALLTDQDAQDDDNDKVVLMTVHSAKGLEFKNVFVVGMEEGLFPSLMGGDSPRALEEERRLFYVAITRAEEHCSLSYARSRYRYGKMEFSSPSRFLKDINTAFINLPNSRLQGGGEANTAFGQPTMQRRTVIHAPKEPVNLRRVSSLHGSSSPSASTSAAVGCNLQVGKRIAHDRFGIGEVVEISGAGENLKATIRFENAGVKQLLLRFARFKVLE